MPKRILIVEPNAMLASQLTRAASEAGWATVTHNSFAGARRELSYQRFDGLAGNIRLGRFNGIHLAYVTKHETPEAAVILYCATHDTVLVREVCSAGAFYEPMETVARSLPVYLAATLPANDRRSPELSDRRPRFEGGRRLSDVVDLPESEISFPSLL